jgi:hypothetical protein
MKSQTACCSTCSTFSSRSNAKRAAEKLLAGGTAPAVDYRIKERKDGRFEITWRTTPVSTGASEPPLTGEPASPTTDAIATEIAQGAAQRNPAPVDPELAAVETPRLIAELGRRGYRTVQARQSKTAELDAAAACGVMPTKPVVTSHWNYHYQRRFDELAELAAAGDWDAVAAYECNGLNSYSKMVRQYRDRLVAAHTAR